MIFHQDKKEDKNICSPNLYLTFYWKSIVVKIEVRGGGAGEKEKRKILEKKKYTSYLQKNDLHNSLWVLLNTMRSKN